MEPTNINASVDVLLVVEIEEIAEPKIRYPKYPPTGAGDRLKRDEWSEGAVSTLLEAYEAKWVLCNRAYEAVSTF